MPWVSKTELARLERDLEIALQRAKDSEDRLAAERERLDGIVASERQGKDWLVVQLASRVVTKHGGYGLDHEPQPKPEARQHPKGFTHEPSDLDLAKLEYYKQCYRQAGKPEEEAEKYWEAEMRGESPAVEYEGEQ